MAIRSYTRAFNGGEISPAMFARIDDAKYQTGLEKCKNFLIEPQGPLINRPGFEYVREVKYSEKDVRLISFSFSDTQTMVLEFGDKYIRFHANGATLLNEGEIYEIETPYQASDLKDLHYVQSADVMTIVHPRYAPMELRRYSAYDWRLVEISFTSSLNPPDNVTAVQTIGKDVSNKEDYTREYAVTSLLADGSQESVRSASVSVKCNPYGDGAYNTVSWGAVANASLYRVYRNQGGIWAFIGQTSDTKIVDENIDPDASITPPLYDDVFVLKNGIKTIVINKIGSGYTGNVSINVSDSTGSGAIIYPVIVDGKLISADIISGGSNYTDPKVTVVADNGSGAEIVAVVDDSGDYPSAVTYYEQRRWFGGTQMRPNSLWATKSGTENDMSYSLPSQDDDRISVRVAAREASRIQHIVPLAQLVLLTGMAEWRVSPLNNDAITPASMSVRPQSYVGSNNVQPLVINNAMIYAASRGGHLRECGYSYQAGGYVTADISLRAPHLFDNKEVVDLSFSKAPWPIIWAVSSDGKLLSMTYIPEQQVGAFSTIETKGEFKACCVVSEGEEDILYCVVERNISGSVKRFVERMHERRFVSIKEANYVDCSGIYRGGEKEEISGLDWLEGEEVAILADGSVEPNQVVKNGKIVLQQPASVVHVGLPYECDIKTLPAVMALQDGSFGSGHRKNVRQVYFRVLDSSGVQTGPSFEELTEYPARDQEAAGSAPDPISDEIGLAIEPMWSNSGQVCVRQAYPLPLRIVSMTVDMEIV